MFLCPTFLCIARLFAFGVNTDDTFLFTKQKAKPTTLVHQTLMKYTWFIIHNGTTIIIYFFAEHNQVLYRARKIKIRINAMIYCASSVYHTYKTQKYMLKHYFYAFYSFTSKTQEIIIKHTWYASHCNWRFRWENYTLSRSVDKRTGTSKWCRLNKKTHECQCWLKKEQVFQCDAV